MDTSMIVALLSLFTLGAVAVAALISLKRTEARRKDPNAPKSRLAADGDPHRPADAGAQRLFRDGDH